jgi:hypothetical protein
MSAIGAIAGPSAAAPALVERRPREANGFAALLDQAVGQAEQNERAAPPPPTASPPAIRRSASTRR